jgi:hypothetical protein
VVKAVGEEIPNKLNKENKFDNKPATESRLTLVLVKAVGEEVQNKLNKKNKLLINLIISESILTLVFSKPL